MFCFLSTGYGTGDEKRGYFQKNFSDFFEKDSKARISENSGYKKAACIPGSCREYRRITMTISYYTSFSAPKAHRNSIRRRKLLPECGARLLRKVILRHIFAVKGMHRKRIAVEKAVIIAVEPVDIHADAALHPDEDLLRADLPECPCQLGDDRPDHAFARFIRAFLRPEIADNHIIAANGAVPVDQIGEQLLALLPREFERLSLMENLKAAEALNP